MKKIIKIAWTELQALFYSPVAWLILVIFAFQTSSIFTNALHENAMRVSMDYMVFMLSRYGFSLDNMLEYLYLYLPLLTMGLMSREYSTGSIKLLFSSPVSNTQIILGKYLAMTIYGFFLVCFMILFLIIGIFTMPGLDVPVVLSGILGIYLLICAYAAIGLFMSTLTSYQVVAAMGTLAIFAGLNFMGNLGQDIPFLRDITYWLSLAGRTNFMLWGLICSEDVMYFLIVIGMFLMLAIVKLKSGRENHSAWTITGLYASVILCAMLFGYTSSRPQLMTYYDVSKTKMNTLTPASQEIMKKLSGGLTITTFVNIFDEASYQESLPKVMNKDMERFRHYLRFKPEMQMKYVYYYDDTNFKLPADNKLSKLSQRDRAKKVCEILEMDFNDVLSPSSLKKIVDLKPEGYKFVRLLERESGEKTFLRVYNDLGHHPEEREITAAFKRIAMKLPTVGFIQGDGERDINNAGDRGYLFLTKDIGTRAALINQGFDVIAVDLSHTVVIPSNINILVLADCNTELSAGSMEKLNRYIARGGNLIIAGEVGHQKFMNPITSQFGVQFIEGQLVQQNTNDGVDIVASSVTKDAFKLSQNFNDFVLYKAQIAMSGVVGLSYNGDKGYMVMPLFVSNPTKSWNELESTNFIDIAPTVNANAGEKKQSYPTVLGLSKSMGSKTQKIVIMGDADFLSNANLNRSYKDFNAYNAGFVMATLHWMSNGEVPIDTSRVAPSDKSLTIGLKGVSILKFFLMGMLPLALGMAGAILLIRRKNR
jgi:ABC-2 type transport system permease protein